jgi:hypothetical protein
MKGTMQRGQMNLNSSECKGSSGLTGGASKNLDHETEQRSLESALAKVTGFGK